MDVNDVNHANNLITHLESLDINEIFARPVSEMIDDRVYKKYLQVIKNKPMDFSTVRSNLLNEVYSSIDEFHSDLRIIFENARQYNEKQSVIFKKATELLLELENACRTFKDEEDEFARFNQQEQQGTSSQEVNNIFLPHPKFNRDSRFEPGPPLSLYQWDPDPTLPLIQVAEAAGIPFEQVMLPCFGKLTTKKKRLEMNNGVKTKRVESGLDFSEFDSNSLLPTNKRDLILLSYVYRRLVSDACEKSLQHGIIENLPVAHLEEDEGFDPDWIHSEEGVLREIAEFGMPGPEFFLIFSSIAVPPQIERFKETGKMWVLLSHLEVKRLFGLSTIRVLILGSEDRYCYVREPLLFSLNQDIVKIKAVVTVSLAADVPKEFLKGRHRTKMDSVWVA